MPQPSFAHYFRQGIVLQSPTHSLKKLFILKRFLSKESRIADAVFKKLARRHRVC